jgi:nucleoid-associated protein EbfC
MGSGFSKMKKQAKQFEAQYEKMREELKNVEAVGSAGNGLVTLVLNGEHEMKSLQIKPDCVDKNDVEGLQDLIRAAYAEALQKIQAQSQQGQQGLSGLPFSF